MKLTTIEASSCHFHITSEFSGKRIESLPILDRLFAVVRSSFQ